MSRHHGVVCAAHCLFSTWTRGKRAKILAPLTGCSIAAAHGMAQARVRWKVGISHRRGKRQRPRSSISIMLKHGCAK